MRSEEIIKTTRQFPIWIYVVVVAAVRTGGVDPVPGTPSAAPAPAAPPAAAPTAALFVNPETGADTNDGSEGAPLRTIQAALEAADLPFRPY